MKYYNITIVYYNNTVTINTKIYLENAERL